MFTLSDIQTAFLTLVGWRQNVDPAGVQLTSLTTSASGIYMNEVHPLLTIANLESIAPDFSLFTYAAWSNATAYAVGDKVTHSSVQYRCIEAHTNQTPPNATYWEVWNTNKAFTEWLTDRMNGATAQFLNDWIGRKFENRSARSIIERERLYTSTGSNIKTIDNPGDKMSGIEFRIIRSRGASARIKEISLHLTDAQSLTVYLYKSGNQTPVQSTSCDYTTAGDVQWFTVDWELKGEGAYYLCYSLNELTGNAYDDAVERTAWTANWQLPGGKYFKAHPFTANIVDVSGVGNDEIGNTLIVSGTDVFVTSQLSYNTQTHGLNVGLSVGCNLTEFVVEQKQLFATAYSLFLAKSLLREMAYNPNARINRNEKNMSREEILYEIDGNPQGISGRFQTGIMVAYERALTAIQFDQTGIDEVCLPCGKKRGLNYGTV